VAREIAGMAAIGSLVFCTDCGNLLEPNTGRKAYIQCDLCGTQNKGMQNEAKGTRESLS
jgi:DNA-directed RNA polymerase I subunit RPA12